MRGKANHPPCFLDAVRITPACAGKRKIRNLCCSLPEDHPRVCGEKPCWLPPPTKYQGSPPRVRGKVTSEPVAVHLSRITPACAGKSAASRGIPSVYWDHPRVCGEKGGVTKAFITLRGSPPRVRGKVRLSLSSKLLPGITPACAGKRCLLHIGGRCCKDHPRVCGEKTHRARRAIFQ